MKLLKIVVMVFVCFLVFCKGKSTESKISDEGIVDAATEAFKEGSYPHPSIQGKAWEITSEDDVFSGIRFRVLDGERIDGCRLLWPVEGDTLANIVWAVHGKGPNVARIMRIVEINDNIDDPNLIRCNKPIKIPVE